MTRGKYAGDTLVQIARQDLQYLRWMSVEWSDETLRSAAEIVLKHFTAGAA
jgi:hypothetical protein